MTPPILQKGQIAAPKTRAELNALIAQRNELQGQLRNAEERRAQLSVQVQMTPADQRGTLNGRIATLDARIQNIESRIDQLDEAISKGVTNAAVAGEEGEVVVQVPPAPPVPPVQEFPPQADPPPGAWTMVPPGEPQGVHPEVVVTGALVSLALMGVVAWVTWRRAMAKFARLGGSASSAGDVARLQQSVDAIAIEVERISEGQRFLTKVLNERGPVAELAARAEAQVPGRREL